VYSNGRVFCGGDAVHRHPPSSGLGLNTCVQDSFNLAWKLAYVVKGHAGSELLETYSVERAPVGKQIVARANQSRVDYGPMKAVFRVDGAENPVAAGIARFKDPGPEGEQARLAAQAALELKNHEFNAQGVEMNQRYASTAIIPEPGAGEEVWERDRELYLQATTRPGAKIPHAWLIDRKGRRVSTLDVTGKGQLSVVTGLAGTAWVEAAAQMDRPYLRAVVTGAKGTEDPYCEWQRRREISEAGALLVRPDGFVAWRHQAAVRDVAEARRLLEQALDTVLSIKR
jgi:2,4-dichlorophenol 6-monooxygenase